MTRRNAQTDDEMLDDSDAAIARAVAGGSSISATELRLEIEAIERIESEIADMNADKKDRYAGAKAKGFDTKTMRRIIALRKMEPHHRQEAESLLETYKAALGMD